MGIEYLNHEIRVHNDIITTMTNCSFNTKSPQEFAQVQQLVLWISPRTTPLSLNPFQLLLT